MKRPLWCAFARYVALRCARFYGIAHVVGMARKIGAAHSCALMPRALMDGCHAAKQKIPGAMIAAGEHVLCGRLCRRYRAVTSNGRYVLVVQAV